MRVGIDVGTGMARAAVLEEGAVPRLMAAIPALARQTMLELVIGEEAAQARAGNGETTVGAPTRLMGRAGQIPETVLARLPYPVRWNGGEAVCNLLYAEVQASDIYGRLVERLVTLAERRLGRTVEAVALTVPATAEDRFRVQARDGVERQGVRVARLINRPTAALLAAAATEAQATETRRVAVVNCDGETTEISVAELERGGVRVTATAGDPTLGGEDMAWAVAEGLNGRFRRTAQVDVFAADEGRLAAWGLRAGVEELLERLCFAREATLVLDHGGGFGRDLATVVRRSDVDAWLEPLMARLDGLCERAMASSGLTTRQVEEVRLIGDWAHLPTVQERVASAFRRPVAALATEKAPLLAVYGAALAAADGKKLVWDVTPYALGINCYYGEQELFSPIIAANTPIPTPEIGAAAAYTEAYQTRFPDQTSVTLDVLQYRGLRDPDPQGTERVTPEACEVLGSWTFDGLRPKKGHTAPFTVTFAIDANGILQLYARETATGHNLQARVERAIG